MTHLLNTFHQIKRFTKPYKLKACMRYQYSLNSIANEYVNIKISAHDAFLE